MRGLNPPNAGLGIGNGKLGNEERELRLLRESGFFPLALRYRRVERGPIGTFRRLTGVKALLHRRRARRCSLPSTIGPRNMPSSQWLRAFSQDLEVAIINEDTIALLTRDLTRYAELL